MSFLLFFLWSVALLFFGVYSERERCNAILARISKEIERNYGYAVRELQELKPLIKEEDGEVILEVLKSNAQDLAEMIILYKVSHRIKDKLKYDYNFKIE